MHVFWLNAYDERRKKKLGKQEVWAVAIEGLLSETLKLSNQNVLALSPFWTGDNYPLYFFNSLQSNVMGEQFWWVQCSIWHTVCPIVGQISTAWSMNGRWAKDLGRKQSKTEELSLGWWVAELTALPKPSELQSGMWAPLDSEALQITSFHPAPIFLGSCFWTHVRQVSPYNWITYKFFIVSFLKKKKDQAIWKPTIPSWHKLCLAKLEERDCKHAPPYEVPTRSPATHLNCTDFSYPWSLHAQILYQDEIWKAWMLGN